MAHMHCKLYKLHQHSMYTLHVLLSFITQLKALVIDWDPSLGTRSTMSLVTKATAAANETCSKQTEQDEADTYTYTQVAVGRGQCHTLTPSNTYLHTLNVN